MGAQFIKLAGWLLVVSTLLVPVSQALEAERIEELQARFKPVKPTVTITYDVSYRFLFLRLARVAVARVETTEGLWLNRTTGQWIPPCFMDFSFHPMDREQAGTNIANRSRLSIDNRIVSVLTMPELDTITYIKTTDEYMNPMLGKKKENRNIHVYDLESGELRFYLKDYLTGKVETNMTGAVDLASQGKEVQNILRIMSQIYYGKHEMITPDSDFRIKMNIDGKVLPFTVKTSNSRVRVEALDSSILSLRVLVEPAPETDVESRNFMLWAASFQDVAKNIKDPKLRQMSDDVPAWSMVPLMADYGMSIGFIRCSMKTISAQSHATEGLAVSELSTKRADL